MFGKFRKKVGNVLITLVIAELCKGVHYCVDLDESFQMSVAKFGVDTAENEPSKISNFIPTQAI